jgi:hypothetical protein
MTGKPLSEAARLVLERVSRVIEANPEADTRTIRARAGVQRERGDAVLDYLLRGGFVSAIRSTRNGAIGASRRTARGMRRRACRSALVTARDKEVVADGRRYPTTTRQPLLAQRALRLPVASMQRDGKKIRKQFATRAEAESWRDDARSAVRRRTLRAPSPSTLRQAGEAWLEDARRGAIRSSLVNGVSTNVAGQGVRTGRAALLEGIKAPVFTDRLPPADTRRHGRYIP